MGNVEEIKHHQQFITLKVKSFAILKEIVGAQEMIVQMPRKDGAAITVADLRQKIMELYPEIPLRKIPIGIAVNCKMANEKLAVNDLDEIALLPPVSGG